MASKHLVMLTDGRPIKSFPIVGKRLLIGKHESCDIVIEDPRVSRRHAEVWADGASGNIRIKDLDSSNGTYVNGARIDEAGVGLSDEIRIGRATFTIQQDVGKSHGWREGDDRPDRALKPPIVMQEEPAELRAYKERLYSVFVERMNRTKVLQEDEKEIRRRVETLLDAMLREFEPPSSVPRATIRKSLLDDVLGYGPLQPYLEDETVTEIMVNNENRIFVEKDGKIQYAGGTFKSREQLMNVIERIVAPLGRRIDESSPLVDAGLPDGSRVNVIIPPLAKDGPSITIRKFRKKLFTAEELVNAGAMSTAMRDFFRICVEQRFNILVSGGTGSGKTTLLNVFALFIPEDQRIVTIEDVAELRLNQTDIVHLEARPPNIEGKGAVTIRDLVRNALRMRPDRIVVGECRGGEALDMLQAMNTGHDGSLTTAHANSPRDALRRLEVMCLMTGMDLPMRAIREQIASAIHLVIQISRFRDGSRRIVQVSEITGMQQEVITMQDIFVFHNKGIDDNGRQKGYHAPTGIVPSWTDELRERGVEIDKKLFQENRV